MRPAGAGRAQRPAAFIGRTDELQELERMLASPSTRLVTLTGPPGVGKTRLAGEVALRSGSRFPDGVRTVELSVVGTAEAALAQIARSCKVGDSPGAAVGDLAQRIGHRLRDATALLLLDGCERVPDLGRELGVLLAAAPRVKVLATSRARFRLAAEHELPVPPLPMPASGVAEHVERLAANDAVRLLVERARRVRPDFELTAGNAAAVSSICVRSDGLPLVIELLAARLATFSPQELAVRVRNRQVLLDSAAGRGGGPVARHRTLRAAIGWSHDLLGPSERRLLRAVSVFPGTWTLAAAEMMLGDPSVDVAAATAVLVEQSLVQRAEPEHAIACYRLLDSVRDFAGEQLHEHGEEGDVRRRHMSYYAALAAAAEAGFGSRDESLAQGWIRSGHVDMRLALDHALTQDDAGAALPLAAATGWFEFSFGLHGDARQAVERALAAAERSVADPPHPDQVAGTLLVSGVLAESRGELALAATRLRRTLTLSEQCGDLRRQAVAHAFLGHVARRAHSFAEASREYTAALALHEATGNEHSRAWAWIDLGVLALEQEQLDTAELHLRNALAWFREADEAWPLGWALWALGETRLRHGETEEAASLLTEALTIHRRTDDLRGVAPCLEALAAVACRRSSGEVASKLLGAATRLREALQAPPTPVSAATVAATRDALAALVEPAEAARAARTGANLPLDEAVALANMPADPVPVAVTSPLSRRQRQVAVLVAAGRTNRQIARVLGITEKTVEVHLSQAMRRINAHNRSELAMHVVDAGLRHPGGPRFVEGSTG